MSDADDGPPRGETPPQEADDDGGADADTEHSIGPGPDVGEDDPEGVAAPADDTPTGEGEAAGTDGSAIGGEDEVGDNVFGGPLDRGPLEPGRPEAENVLFVLLGILIGALAIMRLIGAL